MKSSRKAEINIWKSDIELYEEGQLPKRRYWTGLDSRSLSR